jgi:sterol desaturase/sphingolipid hydroxylase (fatty acid hydroxylase superfamily)
MLDLLIAFFTTKGKHLTSLAIELAFVLAVATAFVMFTRGRRRTRVQSIIRVLLTPRIWLNKSALMDYQYTALNFFVFPFILVVTVVSAKQVGEFVASHATPTTSGDSYFSETQARILLNLVLFLALEFAYWFNHYLSHKVPIFWEFHKVHHTAEVLTPLTNFRVHPVDSIVYYNMQSLAVGLAYGLAIYLMNTGPVAMPEGTLTIAYMWLYGHLQHSHLWIAFPGPWGKIFFSPAHHQIHHSKAKIHHNTNFGMSLAIFDWMFGTLYVPTLKNQHLEFGVSNDHHFHRVGTSLVDPLKRAWKRLTPASRSGAALPAATPAVGGTD